MTSKKTKKSKKTVKKGKVYIPPYKILLLCLSIIAVCIFFLLIVNIISISGEKEQDSKQETITERFEETKNPETPQKQTQTEKKPETTKKTPETKPVTPPKTDTSKKDDSTKKAEPAKPNQIEQEKTPAKDTTKKASFNFPNAKNNAQLVFVFDDGGQNLSQLDKFLSLPFDFTVAVLPRLPHSVESAERVRKSGNEVILHQPMQSINLKINPGEGSIKPDMTEEEIRTTLIQNIFEIAPIAGINNHEGSLITSDKEKMAVVLQVASQEGLFFLDSRTNTDTVVPEVAKQLGYSYFERNVFLDNTKERADILNELSKGIDIANKTGVAIMIGHIWSADVLPDILNEVYPELKQKGYKFCTVTKSSGLRS